MLSFLLKLCKLSRVRIWLAQEITTVPLRQSTLVSQGRSTNRLFFSVRVQGGKLSEGPVGRASIPGNGLFSLPVFDHAWSSVLSVTVPLPHPLQPIFILVFFLKNFDFIHLYWKAMLYLHFVVFVIAIVFQITVHLLPWKYSLHFWVKNILEIVQAI